jgi:hypothetical protein
VPNTNPQAIAVANGKIRVAADRMGQLYNFYKALQAEGTAEGWLTLFPADAEVVVDGAAADGRAVISNQEVRDFIADVTAFITWIEANGNLIRNRALKIAVNPERY